MKPKKHGRGVRPKTADEELRFQTSNPAHMTPMDEARALYRWARRRRFKTVQETLERILDKLDTETNRQHRGVFCKAIPSIRRPELERPQKRRNGWRA